MGKKELSLRNTSLSANRTLTDIARLQLADEVPERTIVHLATLGETYIAEMLTSLIALEDGNRSKMYEALLGEVREGMFNSWPAMFEWLRRGFGLSLLGEKEVQDFTCCVDLRNSIVHGNSRLTRMQTKQFEKSIDLRKKLERTMHVAIQGSRIMVDRDSSQAGIKVSRSFIFRVDDLMIQQYPSLLAR
ncbi:hypothetical protein [Lentzea fradiae]|uniref:hypothetical protein n=1 Tax=Lentzea fradiae TaxID=200378 RepID=UPI00115FE34E|nr:hypothetical protein [Lentzea fradiae]